MSCNERRRRPPAMPRPVLSEELEKMVLAFVQPLPHFVTWQLVSRRWRTILSSLPAYDANMDCIRPVDSALYLALLQRWPMLRSVTMTHDVHVSNEMTWQLGLAQLTHLEHLSLRRTFTKVLQELFKSCPAIRSLSVLAGSDLRLPTVKTSLMHLQKLELQAATLANNSSIMSIVRNAPQLTHFVVSAASDVTSQVLTQLATSCPHIQQVVLNQCGLMVASQVDTFLRKFHAQLTWVDLSHCHDLKLFLMNADEELVLDQLQVLVVDSTLVRDSVLQSIRCPKLQVLSIQNCRCITDTGVVAFMAHHVNAPLKIFEAKNTAITEISVDVIERSLPNLTHIGVESCRGVPRATRQRCALQCHMHASQFERVLVATNAAAYRKDNVGVEFAATPIKPSSMSYGLDEEYTPRDGHQEYEEDHAEETPQRRGRRRRMPTHQPAKRSRNITN